VLAFLFECSTDPEAGFFFQEVGEPIFLSGEGIALAIEDGEPHAAGDIDANRIGDDGSLGGEHPADREAVSEMGIGHEGTFHRHRQGAGVGHLLHGLGFEPFAPLTPRSRFGAWGEGRAVDGPSQWGEDFVGEPGGRIGYDGEQIGFDRFAVAAVLELETHPIGGEPERFTGWDAESEEIFGFHDCEGVEVWKPMLRWEWMVGSIWPQ